MPDNSPEAELGGADADDDAEERELVCEGFREASSPPGGSRGESAGLWECAGDKAPWGDTA